MATPWESFSAWLGSFVTPTPPPRQVGARGRPRAYRHLSADQRPMPVNEAMQQWATRTVEKIRYAVMGGSLKFLPWLDHYTSETFEIRSKYPEMLRDSTVKAGFLTKILAVCQLPLQVHPTDPDNPRDRACAEFVKYAFERIGITEENGSWRPASTWAGPVGAGWSILSGAILRGHSVSELIWEKNAIERGRWKGKRRWKALKSRDTQFLQLSIDAHRNITAIRGTAYNAGRVFRPEDFVIYTYLPLYENPVGMSDFRAAWRPFWIKDAAWQLRGLHLDRYTGPFLIGKFPQHQPQLQQVLEASLQNARAGGYLTAPTDAMIEAITLAQSGTTDFQSALADCDKEILVGLMGAHLQVLEGQVKGARGDTQVHQETSELYQWLLAETLANVYQTQMVPDLVLENWHDVEPPRITLGAVSEQDLVARANLNKLLQSIGLKLSKKEEYTYFARSEPTDPDDVLEPPGMGGPPSGGDDGSGGAGGLAGLLGGGGGGNGMGGEPEPEEDDTDLFAEGQPCKRGERADVTGCIPASGKKAKQKEASAAQSAVTPQDLERYGLSPREADRLYEFSQTDTFDPLAAAKRYAFLSQYHRRTGWDLVRQAIRDVKDSTPAPAAAPAPPRPPATPEQARSQIETVRANPTPEGIRGLAETLASMPVKDIRALQKELGIVAGGVKSARAQKVAREATRRLTVRQQFERQARTKGITTRDLHTTARQVRGTYNEVTDEANNLLQEARRQYAQFTDGGRLHRGMKAFKGGDYTQIPHFDQIAASLQRRYPEILGQDEQEAYERLFDLLAAGPVPRMNYAESYEKALDEIEAYGVPERPSRTRTSTPEDDDPFSTEGLGDEDEPGFTGIDALGREWRDGELVAEEEDDATSPQSGQQPLTTPEQSGRMNSGGGTTPTTEDGTMPAVTDEKEARRLELERQMVELEMIPPIVLAPEHEAERVKLADERDKRILKPKEQARLAALEMARRLTPEEARKTVSRAYAMSKQFAAGTLSTRGREDLEDLKSKIGTPFIDIAYKALEQLDEISGRTRKAGERARE